MNNTTALESLIDYHKKFLHKIIIKKENVYPKKEYFSSSRLVEFHHKFIDSFIVCNLLKETKYTEDYLKNIFKFCDNRIFYEINKIWIN